MFKKQNIHTVIFILLALPLTSVYKIDAATSNLKVIYIANAGFIVSSGAHKVAFDALFEGYHSGMHVEPSAVTIDKMINCQMPFDSLDLITISHEHRDHISPEIVGQHLECNSKGMVICNHEVANMMQSYTNYSQVKERIKEIMPELNSTENDTIDGIPLKIFRSRHAMPQFKNMVNLGILINLNGIKIFHSGDSWGEYIEELEAFQLNKENIDLAFLHYSFFKIPDVVPDLKTGVQKVKQYLNPKNIILMHVSPADNHLAQALRDSIANDFQQVIFFASSMDSIIFSELSRIKNTQACSLPHIRLNQNYPNPFNPATTINYRLTNPGHVNLKILNVAGQEIVTLVNKFQTAGEYQIKWIAGGLPSGVYFFTLQVGNPSTSPGQIFSKTKKLLLLK